MLKKNSNLALLTKRVFFEKPGFYQKILEKLGFMIKSGPNMVQTTIVERSKFKVQMKGPNERSK